MENRQSSLVRRLSAWLLPAIALVVAQPTAAQQDETIETVIVTASRDADAASTLPTAWSIVSESISAMVWPDCSR